MPKKKQEIVDLPFEITPDLGGCTGETPENKKIAIKKRADFKGGKVTQKALNDFQKTLDSLE